MNCKKSHRTKAVATQFRLSPATRNDFRSGHSRTRSADGCRARREEARIQGRSEPGPRTRGHPDAKNDPCPNPKHNGRGIHIIPLISQQIFNGEQIISYVGLNTTKGKILDTFYKKKTPVSPQGCRVQYNKSYHRLEIVVPNSPLNPLSQVQGRKLENC